MGKSKEIDLIEYEGENGKVISRYDSKIFPETEFPGCFEIEYKINGAIYCDVIPYSRLIRIREY